MKAKLILDNELTRFYQISTGEKIKLSLDDSLLTITVENSQNQEIGSMEFMEIESEYDSYFKLVWIHLDKLESKYTHKGLGRACIEYFNDYFGITVTAEYNDGQQKDDGSHLTQDAPGFVQRLRDEGLIT